MLRSAIAVFMSLRTCLCVASMSNRACTGDEQMPQLRVMFRRRLGTVEQAEGVAGLTDQHGQAIDGAEPGRARGLQKWRVERLVDHVERGGAWRGAGEGGEQAGWHWAG